MKNVVAYCRVSTDAQAGEDRFGIEAQKEQIMMYCAKNDMQISEWFIDEGESGAKMSRPALDRLLFGEVTNPPVEGVVVAKTDRISREITDYYYYKMILRNKNIELYSVAEDFGTLGVFKEILEMFTITVAKLERENITKRTSSGRQVKAAKGGYAGGRPPYGYQVVDRQLVVLPKEAEVVREIFRMRRDGATLQEIVDALNAKGAKNKSGGKFSISTVQVILGNENLYRGMYKYGKSSEWVQGQHEPILV